MPTYEYQCRACGHAFEAFQKMSDAPLETCPACQANAVQKLLSASGFQLKGTGWYATDFRNKPQPKSDAAAKTENNTEKKTDTTTTDSKNAGEKSA